MLILLIRSDFAINQIYIVIYKNKRVENETFAVMFLAKSQLTYLWQ